MAKTMEMLGISVNEFRQHLERQWSSGMTWTNHGNGDDDWSIDHIVPVSKFDFVDPVQQRICFHWLNQRPLWHKSNAKKRDSMTGVCRMLPEIIRLEIKLSRSVNPLAPPASPN